MSNDLIQMPIDPAGEAFVVNRDCVFLNHGSFGACPTPVFDAYQHWQRELESQPVEFLQRRWPALNQAARTTLAEYLGTGADQIVFVPNATFGVNIVAHSLLKNMPLAPGDEVLTTDHAYGASDRAWEYACGQRGAVYVRQHMPLPVTDATDFVAHFWEGVNDRTRIIFLSHITSSTALIFPIEPIIARARAAGILTVIDGAHAPGQIDLTLDEMGADFYTGNCHKWLCAPKGAAFLYARPAVQDLLDPLVVSWGYHSLNPGPSRFQDLFGWMGTSDPAASLSVTAAIAFQRAHDWPRTRAACRALLGEARERIAAIAGQGQVAPDDPAWWQQLAVIPLPAGDAPTLQRRLWDGYRIEVPIIAWNDRRFVRVSIQAYNRPGDIEQLVTALRAEL